MGVGAEFDIEQRIARVEAALAVLAARVEQLAGAARPASPTGSAGSPPPRGSTAGRSRTPPWFTTKSAEWWLGRFGVVFTCLAVIFLYQYAVERNWITPVVRVVIGSIVGAGLMYAGARIRNTVTERSDNEVGLRELLLAGGLAAWYTTAYAAAVIYELIPIQAARAIFLALSIASAWLSLRERRSLFGVVSVAIGFAAPFLLRSEADSLAAFSVYVAALTAVGFVLYLMRGWQSVLWVTFVGAWWTTAIAAGAGGNRSVALTLLVVAITAAFIRVPAMRRQLLATGAERYVAAPPSRFGESLRNAGSVFANAAGGGVTAHDSLALWCMPIASPLIMLVILSQLWPSLEAAVWGAAAVIAGYAAFHLSQTLRQNDPEVTHVEVTAAAVWTLAGLWWLSSTLGDVARLDAPSIALALTALHAAATLSFGPASSRSGPRAVAITSVAVSLAIVFSAESVADARPKIPFEQTAAELIVLAVSAMIWKRLRDSTSHRWLAVLFGAAAYVALLVIAARLLGDVWPPLVTASYAIAGAVLLIASRRVADGKILRLLGGGTMLLVAARLFIVDLARVETIWRVVLFLVCGLLFLYTSYRLQPSREPAA